ncbi:792_t:CDS:1 [Scutellospora calospora]|uniref:792_t:CDS:1 n=1 Tax=Scutellospora calospora TaxID=85575 RepID=A0ACA9JWV3_9GLOM|nr:792_t:CDS:1 [Scutellospora calospora]
MLFIEWGKKINDFCIVWFMVMGSFVVPLLIFGFLGIFYKKEYGLIFISTDIVIFITSITLLFFGEGIIKFSKYLFKIDSNINDTSNISDIVRENNENNLINEIRDALNNILGPPPEYNNNNTK